MADYPPIAIFYHPDGFETGGRPLMGRRAAGKSLLDAWFKRRSGGELHCHTGSKAHFETFAAHAKSRGAAGKAIWLPLDRPELLQQTGTLYFPGPDIGLNAWRRYRRNPQGWSILGVTHTICTKAAMDGIADWLTAPVEDWDAVICTSQAVRASVDLLLARQADDLARRLGATRFTRPQLPVIPLGIDTASFAPDPALRAATRARLGIEDGDVAALFVGRLSIYGKAHPLPMFLALERAARSSGKRLHLILAGWFATPGIEKVFRAGAAEICPSVTVHVVDGRQPEELAGAWRAGDFFVSLVDNIQETFGLTPIEAMAAGLPAVVSDWDGYRETVRHGVDGLRVPTLSAPPLFGEPLIDRYAADIDSYDVYLARSTYLVSVDVEAAAAAFHTLIVEPDLRASMAAAGLERARSQYDWSYVLDKYDRLAVELAARRRAANPGDRNVRRVWPARLSPFELFGNYPTRMPAAADNIRIAAGNTENLIALVGKDANPALDSSEAVMAAARALVQTIGPGVATVGSVVGDGNDAERAQRLAMLMRLAKFGVVAIEPAEGPAGPKKGPNDPG